MMPITVLDYVKHVVGEQDSYSAEDFYSVGVDVVGGCEICGAAIAGYNAYPSRSGYWRCAECIGRRGFTTVEQFINFDARGMRGQTDSADDPRMTLLNCPACGGVENITEIWEDVFKCADCGSAWRL